MASKEVKQVESLCFMSPEGNAKHRCDWGQEIGEGMESDNRLSCCLNVYVMARNTMISFYVPATGNISA